MISNFRGLLALGCMLLVGAMTGCAPKPAPGAPKVRLTRDHFSGSPLSGPTTRPIDPVSADNAVMVDVRIVALAASRIESLPPVGPNVRLISTSRGAAQLMATGELTRACRFATAAAAETVESQLATAALGPAPQISESTLALSPSVTGSIQLDDATSTGSGMRSVQIYVHRPASAVNGADQIEIALAITDFKPVAAAIEGAGPATQPAPISGLTRELIVLQSFPITDTAAAALQIPFDFSDGIHHSALAIFRVSRDRSNPQFAEAIAGAQMDIKASTDAAAKQPPGATLAIADWPGFETALAAVRNPATSRVSLSYLAGQTGARICEDAALVATDQVLADIAILIDKEISKPNRSKTTESLGWALDVATLQMLSSRQSSNALPTELLAVLLRHTGQVGSNSGSVGEILSAVGNRRDFESRVSAENFVYLEDNSPAARVRAFDWLAARGEAPPGYEPLAAPKQRQDALQKAYDALTAKSAQQAQQGGRP